MLMDEPFGALDPLVRKDIRAWLRGLHTQLGLTSVFITHDQGEAIELADRVAVMRGGRILQLGTPAELEAAPCDPFVFEFLGPTLRFLGIVRDGLMTLDEVSIPPLPVKAPPGPAVALCRPHQIALIPGGAEHVITRAHRAGPLTYYAVAARGRTLELVSAAETLPTGTWCGLSMLEARVFPLGSANEAVPAPDAGVTKTAVAARGDGMSAPAAPLLGTA
jgi:sulfate transport system ATP-binding protein